MGAKLLRVLRIFLVLLAFSTLGMTVYLVRLFQISISGPQGWSDWLPLFLAIFSVIAYSWALWAQKDIISWNGVRYIGSFIIGAAWLVSPIHTIFRLLDGLHQAAMEYQFFEVWNCSWQGCKISFAIDICGLVMALFVLLEVILAYRYERSSNARKAGTLPTTVIAGPGPVQQYPAQPVQQFAYTPIQQQPGQPAVYYPQPGMTAPFQLR